MSKDQLFTFVVDGMSSDQLSKYELTSFLGGTGGCSSQSCPYNKCITQDCLVNRCRLQLCDTDQCATDLCQLNFW